MLGVKTDVYEKPNERVTTIQNYGMCRGIEHAAACLQFSANHQFLEDD